MSIESTNRAEQMATYTNNTRINARHAVALARQLQLGAPPDLSPDERAALEATIERAKDVREAQDARERQSGRALREPRNAVIVSWTSLYGSLMAVTQIPSDVGADGAEAKAIGELLFPEATSFTRLDGAALWDRTDSLLQRIDALSLQPRIDALINPRLLASVRAAFMRLSRAIQVTGTVAPSLPKNALLEANGRFSFALAKYARALSVRVSDDDDAAFARFMTALAPIDALRVLPGASEEAEDEPDDDVMKDESPVPEPDEPEPDDPFVT